MAIDENSRACRTCGKPFIPRRKHQVICSTGCRRKLTPACDLFMQKVSPEPNTGCWLWMGKNHPQGYGVFLAFDGPLATEWLAHRYSYQQFVGPIPDGLVLDHKCRVKCCVNPAHLEAVTIKENTRRGLAMFAGEHNRSKTECIHGHPFTPENTYWRSSRFGRHCRTCIRNWGAANKAKAGLARIA